MENSRKWSNPARFPNRLDVPKEQIGLFHCTLCDGGVFKATNGLSFVYDKLDPSKMQPAPVMLYTCMECGGYLQRCEDGTYMVIRVRGDEGIADA